jgi:very-short-patch-repair endonuclease
MRKIKFKKVKTIAKRKYWLCKQNYNLLRISNKFIMRSHNKF